MDRYLIIRSSYLVLVMTMGCAAGDHGVTRPDESKATASFELTNGTFTRYFRAEDAPEDLKQHFTASYDEYWRLEGSIDQAKVALFAAAVLVRDGSPLGKKKMVVNAQMASSDDCVLSVTYQRSAQDVLDARAYRAVGESMLFEKKCAGAVLYSGSLQANLPQLMLSQSADDQQIDATLAAIEGQEDGAQRTRAFVIDKTTFVIDEPTPIAYLIAKSDTQASHPQRSVKEKTRTAGRFVSTLVSLPPFAALTQQPKHFIGWKGLGTNVLAQDYAAFAVLVQEMANYFFRNSSLG